MSSVRTISSDLLKAEGCGINYYIDGEFEWGSASNTQTKQAIERIFSTYQPDLETRLQEIITHDDAIQYPSFYATVLKSISKNVVADYKKNGRTTFPSIDEIIAHCHKAVLEHFYLKDLLDRVRSELSVILHSNRNNPYIQELSKEYRFIDGTIESGQSESNIGIVQARLQAALNTASTSITANEILLKKAKTNAVTQLLATLEQSMKQFDLIKDDAARQASLKAYKKRQNSLEIKIEDKTAAHIKERKEKLRKGKKEPAWITNMEIAFRQVLSKIPDEKKAKAEEKHINVTKLITRLITIPDVYAEEHKAWKLLRFITLRRAKKTDDTGISSMLYGLGHDMYKQYCNITSERYFAEAHAIEDYASRIYVNALLQAKYLHDERGSEFRDESRRVRAFIKGLGSVDLDPESLNTLLTKNQKLFKEIQKGKRHRPQQLEPVRRVTFSDAPAEKKEMTSQAVTMLKLHSRQSSSVEDVTIDFQTKAAQSKKMLRHRRDRRSSLFVNPDQAISLISIDEESGEHKEQSHARRRSSLPSGFTLPGAICASVESDTTPLIANISGFRSRTLLAKVLPPLPLLEDSSSSSSPPSPFPLHSRNRSQSF